VSASSAPAAEAEHRCRCHAGCGGGQWEEDGVPSAAPAGTGFAAPAVETPYSSSNFRAGGLTGRRGRALARDQTGLPCGRATAARHA
jgi:hypothetical protein